MTEAKIAKMIARRVRYGNNEQESIALLNELIATFSLECNLDSALKYHGFTS
jgi:hypothetical protein